MRVSVCGNASLATDPNSAVWGAIHDRFAAADAERRAWLDKVVRSNPKCIASGKRPKGKKGTGVNCCTNGCGTHVHKRGPCASCRYGDEVKFCEDGCGASWRRGDMPLRKACPACAQKRKHLSRRQRNKIARAA